MNNKKFTTVGIFQYSAEAQIIKGRLESDGIEAFLSDNLTIDVDPMVSNAIGGIKLNVLTSQANEAKSILDVIQPYAVDDEGKPLTCPKCNSSRVELFSTVKDMKSFFGLMFGFLFSTLPFYTKHNYRCEDCHAEFDLKMNSEP